MSNDLEVTTGQQQVAVQTPDVVKKVSDLEKGGYYKNVISPEEYLSGKSTEGSKTNNELEIYDDKDNEHVDNKSLDPLKHWNAKIQKKYDECTDSQKQAWLDSFKIIEKGYVKQLNALKEDIMMAAPIVQMMEPYKDSLKKLNISAAEYLKYLITFDELLGANPVYEIARLISVYKVSYNDLYNTLAVADKDVKEESSINKYVNPLRQEISQLKKAMGIDGTVSSEVEEEAKTEAKNIIDKLTMFFEQRNSEGKLVYPGAFENISEIIELVQTGETLHDAYNIVVKGDRKNTENDVVDNDSSSQKKAPMDAREQEYQMLRSIISRLK
jgi:hypothetical protein